MGAASYMTDIVGVFGFPVAENPTGVMQNAAFEALNLNWRYLNIEVAADDLGEAIGGLRAMRNFQGMNLTIPHKVEVIQYLKTPPSRDRLVALYRTAGMTPREGLRTRQDEAKALLDASDDAILDAMMANPVLIERPLVETDKGVRLCRPQEKVREIL